MTRVRLLFAVMLTASSCANANGMPENRKLWHDKVDRDAFVHELRVRKIPFRIDSEGAVWYPAQEVDAIDEISKNMISREAGVSGFSFEAQDDVARFKKRLESARIPYQVKHRFGREWVTWDPKYEQQARAIQEAIEDEGSTRHRSGAGAKR